MLTSVQGNPEKHVEMRNIKEKHVKTHQNAEKLTKTLKETHKDVENCRIAASRARLLVRQMRS